MEAYTGHVAESMETKDPIDSGVAKLKVATLPPHQKKKKKKREREKVAK